MAETYSPQYTFEIQDPGKGAAIEELKFQAEQAKDLRIFSLEQVQEIAPEDWTECRRAVQNNRHSEMYKPLALLCEISQEETEAAMEEDV